MKRISVVLNGYGVYDGNEIHGAVITLLAVARNDAQAACFTPDKPQRDVVNHLTGGPLTGQRNVLVEAARIARGDILPLTQAYTEAPDALIIPGGFGVAKNLSSFTAEGSKCQVDRDLQAPALVMHQAGKPLDFMYIAPALLPKIFAFPLHITIRTDLDTTDVIEEMGAEHVPYPIDDIVVDEKNKVVITPAYILAENIAQATTGIEKLVARVLALSAWGSALRPLRC